ncbi:MAG TPA: DUF2339 domain-containing protein, partial [Novosphingobium sp.]|nr:DUF2339 domain-containing protein [Novosphingobium sp.]
FGAIFGAGMGAWLRSVLKAEVAREVHLHLAGLNLAPAAPEEAEAPLEDWPEPATAPPAPEPVAKPARRPEPADALAQTWPETPPAPAVTAPAATYRDEPNLAEQLIQRTVEWFTGGNTIIRVGLVVLFVGLVFLARLVANAGLFPLEARLATVGLAGAALLGVGWWKRIERPDFGLHLQGAGVAVMYLTVFAAARIYEVMPPLAAFAFMIVFAGLGAVLAVLQNSRVLALGSFLGGYAVPVLLGGEAETPLGLFTYITVLNLALMGIAWKKSWRVLNLLGFFATFGLATLWGFGAYEDRHFLICEAFLAVSVGIYLATALLYAHNTPGKLGNVADSTLLFGTALAGFGLQAGLVHDKPYAAAWSALAFGAVYLAVAGWALKRREQGMGLLFECVLAIGIGFITLAIPLALDVKWTGAAWALEGAGAYWIGARQGRWMPRAFGLALQAVGAFLTLGTLAPAQSAIPLANTGFFGPLLIAVPVLLTAWWLRRAWPHSGSRFARSWEPVEAALAPPWFLAGFLFAVLACLMEFARILPQATDADMAMPVFAEANQTMLSLLAVLGLMAAADLFGRRHDWAVASWPGLLSLPVIAYAYLLLLIMGRRVYDLPELAGWVLAFGIHLWLLRRRDRANAARPSRWDGAVHTGGALLLTAMLADALFGLIERASLWDSSWAGVVFLVAATAMLFALTRWAGRGAPGGVAGLGWPLHPHARAYWWRAGTVLAFATYAGALGAGWFAQGDAAPLPYVPLLNPIDLAVGLAIAALAYRRQVLKTANPQPRLAAWIAGNGGLGALALLGFVAVNGIWVRTAHHFMAVPWDYTTLSDPTVLTGFSILWTLIAMGLMLHARRSAQRGAWISGAALLGVVVAKLLFVDMSQAEGIARIVAFIGVGVLMLLIGYFVPLPPRKGDEEKL